jgi:hypothetical protein
MRAALLAVVAGAVLAAPAAPSQAAPTQASDCSGVTVVVDFASLGGGDKTRCAPGDPDSGVAALRGAGFEPTRAAQESGYFVCRIDGKPANDPCQRASPEDAYWSYWRAKPGGTWTFSNEGAGTSDPEPGDVEGWAFGAGDPPSTPPPARRKASPAAAPTPQRTTAAPAQAPSAPSAAPRPTRTSTAPSAVASTGRSTAPASPRGSTPASASAGASASPATPTEPSAGTSPPTSARPLTADVPARQDDGGAPWAGVLLAIAVLAALGAAAAFQAQKRR